MREKEKKIANRINLRITDKTVLNLLEDLYSSPSFRNHTEVLNFALALGVAELYADTFGENKQKEQAKENVGEISKSLRNVRITLDQNAVTLSICEKLITTLYNLAAAQCDGLALTKELFDSGVLDQLPPHIEAEKQMMIKAEFIKRRKK